MSSRKNEEKAIGNSENCNENKRRRKAEPIFMYNMKFIICSTKS